MVKAGLGLAQRLSRPLAARWAESLFFTPPRLPAAKAPLPVGAERLTVPGGAGPIAAWSWGEGPAVYLVHGWGGRGAQLSALVAPLVSRGFRVIAVDGPGHGASAGRLSSGPEIGRALAASVAQEGPAHAVVAHSLGAAATVFAMREGLRVDRLVFIGAPANPLVYVERFARRLGIRADVQEEMRVRSERRIRARWEDLPLLPLRGLASPPPVLVVHDRDDREVAFAEAPTIVEAWPAARLMETRGLGHQRILRNPAVVQAVSDFVAGVDRAGAMPLAEGDAAAEEACVHGRTDAPSDCEACALETELFAPSRRRRMPVAVSAWR